MKKNLMYHIWPVKGNGTWQRNVDQLLKRIHIFNGLKIIGIVTDSNTDDLDCVLEKFDGIDINWVIKNNNPNLREVQTLLPMLEILKEHGEGITFFGHAKGVTKPVNRGVTVHPWADVMYETCLDYLPLVEKKLQNYSLAGSFKKIGYAFNTPCPWHFSGSFYWFRNDTIFNRNWKDIERVWWGAESYVGRLFAQKEAYCLFHRGWCPTMNLYSMDYWQLEVISKYEEWKEENKCYLL